MKIVLSCLIALSTVGCYKADIRPSRNLDLSVGTVGAALSFKFSLQYYKLFSIFAETTSGVRASYFAVMQKYVETELTPEPDTSEKRKLRALLLVIATPAVITDDSAFFREYLIPKFNEMTVVAIKGAEVSDISQISEPHLHRTAALKSLQAALTASLIIASAEDIVQIQDALRTVGQATISPLQNDKVLEVATKMNSLTLIKQKLSSSSRTSFLAQALELAVRSLEATSN